MIKTRIVGLLCLSAALAVAPISSDLAERLGLRSSTAYAKSGNDKGGDKGNDKGGDRGGSRGNDRSSGSSGHSSGSHASAGKTANKGKDPVGNSLDRFFGGGKKIRTVSTESKTTSKRNVRANTVRLAERPEKRNLSPKLAGLNSLKRDYHAYMNSNDPRLAALSAYVVSYAEFELANGIEPLPSDPLLGDEALHDALLAAANRNRIDQYGEDAYVDDAVMDWAKDILGVGPSVGKIDQVRDVLAADRPTDDEPNVQPEEGSDVFVVTR